MIPPWIQLELEQPPGLLLKTSNPGSCLHVTLNDMKNSSHLRAWTWVF